MKAFFLYGLFIFLAIPAFASVAASSGQVPTPTTESVTANLGTTSYTIPTDFTGWSEEMDDLINGNFTGATGTSWCSLVNMLGSNGVLRIGGTDSDSNPAPALTQNIANGLSTFLTCLGGGWTLIYGLNLCVNDTGLMLTQAGYVVTAVGLTKSSFQFGNEPTECGYTNTTWTTAWNNYYSTLTGTYATAKVDGPDTGDQFHAGILAPLTSIGESGLDKVTYHSYGLCCGNGAGAPGDYYTAKQVITAANSSYNGMSTLTAKDRITETGTEVVGGQPGVSDRAVAATYYLDEAIWTANAGVKGINPHNYFTAIGRIGQAKYNPFVLQGDGGVSPAPQFYGMVLFSKLLNQTTVSITKSGTGNVNCIATNGSSGGNANILCVNNDPGFPVTITPSQTGASWSTASALDVEPTGSAWCFDANMILGGKSIGESGAWSGSSRTISNGQTFTIQPCGAVLFQLQT